MYTFRMVQPWDRPWLEQAAVSAAWESLSADERAGAAPGTVAHLAQQQLHSVLGGDPGAFGIVAQVGTVPVGFVLAMAGPDTSTGEVHGHLLSVWVAPQHRRRGLARQLREGAELLFGQLGLRKVKLWTGLHNQAAVRLAQGAGYVPEGLIGMKKL